ncbi:MAG TPA: chromate efflux transporter [Armatimonadota bacterium]|nr:chromate efflux transporter [Armatimonadota bacterium]
MPIEARCPRVSLLQLALSMLYVGIAGYGGGPAIIAIFKELYVNRKGWLHDDVFLTGISLSQLIPGANALSMVVYLGYNLCGPLGALIAPICFIFPSLVLMTVLSALYFSFGSLPITKALFTGLGAIVVGLILNALLVMGKTAIKDFWSVGIAIAVFILMIFFNVPIVIVIVISAFAGLLIFYRPKNIAQSDTLPAPTNITVRETLLFWGRWLLFFLVVAILAYFVADTAAFRLFLALFHVGALTFGGGYSSVPLFQHEAVAVHHWLTSREFLDGLALGQITPGPVLITGTFIGYRVMGILGAVIGTIAVFSPGGLAMYFVAHQHEQVKHLLWLQTMVRGIVAGFIGVLLSVTVHLIRQSIFDWKTALLAVASAVILIVAKKDPLWVILGGAIVSILLFS